MATVLFVWLRTRLYGFIIHVCRVMDQFVRLRTYLWGYGPLCLSKNLFVWLRICLYGYGSVVWPRICLCGFGSCLNDCGSVFTATYLFVWLLPGWLRTCLYGYGDVGKWGARCAALVVLKNGWNYKFCNKENCIFRRRNFVITKN